MTTEPTDDEGADRRGRVDEKSYPGMDPEGLSVLHVRGDRETFGNHSRSPGGFPAWSGTSLILSPWVTCPIRHARRNLLRRRRRTSRGGGGRPPRVYTCRRGSSFRCQRVSREPTRSPREECLGPVDDPPTTRPGHPLRNLEGDPCAHRSLGGRDGMHNPHRIHTKRRLFNTYLT